ncbi:50S ribosomal protein L30 [Thermonema rossianum]|uniref:50S ribosomal protein L30 n=1 Tax=Thermonema rossianum TaxID=55505 RepID=UPI0005708739|nr:50S ribosomal protein L30 [Thermonema rossianum]
MARVKIKQVKSLINRPKKQRQTIEALGLGKINKTVEHELNPAIEGMIRKVAHLIEVEHLS